MVLVFMLFIPMIGTIILRGGEMSRSVRFRVVYHVLFLPLCLPGGR
jgi:hypothetical protein